VPRVTEGELVSEELEGCQHWAPAIILQSRGWGRWGIFLQPHNLLAGALLSPIQTKKPKPKGEIRPSSPQSSLRAVSSAHTISRLWPPRGGGSSRNPHQSPAEPGWGSPVCMTTQSKRAFIHHSSYR
jgi:hypothetical protein